MAQGYSVPLPQRLFTAAGLPADGWFITTYVAGTTTPLTTYSNATLTSANTNPIETDADGYYRCFVAAGVLVKIAVTNEASVAQFTLDNLEPMVDASGSSPSVTAVPTGGILAYGAAAAPTGFLLCDGSLVSRATYAALFAVVSTTFGAGDGATTFGLPDLRQRFPIGKAASGTGATLGGTGGTIDHVHVISSHTHQTAITRDGWGSALNTPSTTGRLNVGDAAGTGALSSSYQPSSASFAFVSDGGTAPNTSTANPPFQAVTFIIKT